MDTLVSKVLLLAIFCFLTVGLESFAEAQKADLEAHHFRIQDDALLLEKQRKKAEQKRKELEKNNAERATFDADVEKWESKCTTIFDGFDTEQGIPQGNYYSKLPFLNRARDKQIIVTWTNLYFLNLTANLVCSFVKLGIDNYLVIPMDADSTVFFQKNNIPYYWAPEYWNGTVSRHISWRHTKEQYQNMIHKKTAMVRDLLQLGLHVVVADADSVWLANPFHYIAAEPRCDVFWMTDTRSTFVEEDVGHVYLNGGFYLARSNPRTRNLLYRWAAMEKYLMWKEQSSLKRLLLQHMQGEYFMFGPPYQLARDDEYDLWLRLCILPPSEFVNGHLYFLGRFKQEMDEKGISQIVVHANAQGGSKQKKMKARDVWLLDDCIADSYLKL